MAGGFNGESLLSSVELYSPDGTCNFELAPLPSSRYGLNLYTYNQQIFACGGQENKDSTSCYRYSPAEGDAAWTEVDFAAYNFPRQMASMAKSGTTVFVSGGIGDGNSTMEYLDR